MKNLAAALVVVIAALAAAFSFSAPLQAQDETYVDLSVEMEVTRSWDFIVRNEGTAVAYGVTVDVELADQAIRTRLGVELVSPEFEQSSTTTCSGEIPGTTCLSGVFSIGTLEPGETVTVGIGSKLASGLQCCQRSTQFWTVPARAVVKNTAPEEEERFKGDNTVTGWIYTNGENGVSSDVGEATANYTLEARVDDLLPDAGGTVKLSFKATMAFVRDLHTLYGVKLRLKLSPGLGTPTATPPGATTFTAANGLTRTWDWDIGTFQSNTPLELEVSTTLDDPLPDGVARSDLCLTAELTARPDNNRNGVQSAEICLREDPVTVLQTGETHLFTVYPCVGVSTYPCSSSDTVEMVVNGGESARAAGIARDDAIIDPGNVIVHVKDPEGRVGSGSSLSWGSAEAGLSTSIDNSRLSSSDWTHFQWRIASVQLPTDGNLSIHPDASRRGVFLHTGTKDKHPPSLTALPGGLKVAYATYIKFESLGTYIIDFTQETRNNVGTTATTTDDVEYTATGTYTFHVGPVAELEVRDGGPQPGLASSQRAFTIVAVNNGPDDTPAAQVTVTGLSSSDYVSHTATAGAFATSTGVWTIGELRESGYYRTIYGRDGEVLTIITSAAVDTEITASASSTQDYQVCIDSSGEDVVLASPSKTACEPTATSTNSWHTAKYFDYISDNSSGVTIKALAGTGEGDPEAPGSLSAEPLGAIALLSWQPPEAVGGRRVSHYEVERSGGSVQTTSTTTRGTIYVDPQGGGGNLAYRVRAVNDRGIAGPWSQVETQAQTGRAGAPTGLTVTASDTTTVSLSWTAPTDTGGMNVTIDGYRIDYSGEDNQVLTAVSDSATTTTTYTHSNLLSGHRYCYRVAAVNTNGPGDFSEWRCATTKDVPGAPAGLSAAASGNDAVALSWAAPSDTGGSDITGYRIESSTDAGGSWQLRESSHSTTTYTHSSLNAGASYCYRVAAVNANGDSAFSGQACATTEDVPGAPENLSATADGENAIDLSWSPPDDTGGLNVTITQYDVEYSVNDGVSWQALATVQSGTTHEDSGLDPGSRRCYRVKAVNTHGEGPVSGQACATTEGAPSAPRNLDAQPDSETSIELTWDAPSDDGGEAVTGYVVQYYSTALEDWDTLASGHATTTYVDTGLDTGVNYCYRVAATNANGTGDYSGQACATTEGLPDAPENPSASVDGKTSITLRWEAPDDTGGASVTAIRYRIDYSTDGGVEWMALEHDHDGTSYGHTGLTPGTTYCYRVAVTHENGVGPYSKQACGTTEGDVEEDLPWEPENVRLTRVGKNFVTLKWDPPSQGGKVEYYEYRHSNDVPIRVGRSTEVTVRGLFEGSTYDFQVRAGNSLGDGEWAPTFSALPVQATTGGVDVRPNPMVVEFKKNAQGEYGTRSFNVKLNGSPRWPLQVGLVWDGAGDALCLTGGLVYQQFRILLPGNPPPSPAFWDDAWWGPPGDRHAARHSTGINIQVDASSCQGGETAVVHLDVGTVPWDYVASASMWDDGSLNINRADWEARWGIPYEGNTGPSVKLWARK